MVRSILAGTTDYSNQTMDDILADLISWQNVLSSIIPKLLASVNDLDSGGYWPKVYGPFRTKIAYAISFFDTTQKEISDILQDLSGQVEAHHSTRLRSLGITARKISQDLGVLWNGEYPDSQKDYGSSSFKKVEAVYAEARDMAIDLMDLTEVADRLSEFTGKRFKVGTTAEHINEIVDVKPNIFGIGINFNELFRRLFKKGERGRQPQ